MTIHRRHMVIQILITTLVFLIVRGGECGIIEKNLRMTAVDISSRINTGIADNTGPFWSWSGLRATCLSPSPSGESKVGWHDTAGNIHITPLNANDTRKTDDIVISRGRMYDLVSHNDGFAILILENDRMYIERYDNSGARWFQTELNDSDDETHEWHGGKLSWDGIRYAAYFAIHATAGWAAGHEGDKLKYIDSSGTILSGGWEWGCSHSMDVRILFAGPGPMPVCISDCYPGKGLYLKNRFLIAESDGDCRGISNARFGQAAYFKGHLALIFLAIDGRTSWDVVFASLSASSPHNVRMVQALTNTQGNEINPKVIAYDQDHLLASWEADGMREFVLLNLDGQSVGPRERIAVMAGPVDDFQTFPNGEIGWAYAWGDLNKLKIMRIQSAESPLTPVIVPQLMLLLKESYPQ